MVFKNRYFFFGVVNFCPLLSMLLTMVKIVIEKPPLYSSPPNNPYFPNFYFKLSLPYIFCQRP